MMVGLLHDVCYLLQRRENNNIKKVKRFQKRFNRNDVIVIHNYFIEYSD